MYSFHTKIVGTTYDGRENIIKDLRERYLIFSGSNLVLVRQYDNIYDSNAVAVFFIGKQLGFLSRDVAAKVAPLMDAGIPCTATVASVTGGGELHYGINIKVCIGNASGDSTYINSQINKVQTDTTEYDPATKKLLAKVNEAIEAEDVDAVLGYLDDAAKHGNEVAKQCLADIYFKSALELVENYTEASFALMNAAAKLGHTLAAAIVIDSLKKTSSDNTANSNSTSTPQESRIANREAYLKKYPLLRREQEIRRKRMEAAQALENNTSGLFGFSSRWMWWIAAFCALFGVIYGSGIEVAISIVVLLFTLFVLILNILDEKDLTNAYNEALNKEKELDKIPPYDPSHDYINE
ncbi:MAG: hypothetical protein IKU61_06725 [Clostridia bacterium]|nr:hypothetical protein [Clostridia bacterium]